MVILRTTLIGKFFFFIPPCVPSVLLHFYGKGIDRQGKFSPLDIIWNFITEHFTESKCSAPSVTQLFRKKFSIEEKTSEKSAIRRSEKHGRKLKLILAKGNFQSIS